MKKKINNVAGTRGPASSIVEVMKKDDTKGYNYRTWKMRVKERFFPKDLVMIEMFHINGSISNLILKRNKHKFNYGGCAYVLDEDRKVWNNSAKMYMFRFHEGFSLPFFVDVSAPKLKKSLPTDDQDIHEISTSFNPYVLVDVLKFEYARGVIQGAEIHDYLKKTFFMTIITLISVIVSLAIMAYQFKWI